MDPVPFFKILDVVRLKRDCITIHTTHKACFVLSCRITGSSRFFCGDAVLNAEQGAILYIPCGSTYQQETAGEELIAVHLEAYAAMPNRLAVFQPEDPQRICALFEKCYAAFVKKEENSACLCMAALYEILAHTRLFAADGQEPAHSGYALAVHRLKAHLYDAALSIETVCRDSGISRAYFNRLFKEDFGVTPLAYINENRISKAKHLLNTGSYTNEEIAALCGFADVKYFYVVFRRLTGQTTRTYVQSAEALLAACRNENGSLLG